MIPFSRFPFLRPNPVVLGDISRVLPLVFNSIRSIRLVSPDMVTLAGPLVGL